MMISFVYENRRKLLLLLCFFSVVDRSADHQTTQKWKWINERCSHNKWGTHAFANSYFLVTSSSSGYLFHTFARNQIRCTWTNRNFRRNRFEIWTLSLILHSINVLFPRNSAECYFAPEHKQVYGLTPSQRLNRRIIIIIVSGPRFCFNAASCTIASTEWVRRHIQCEFIVAVVFVLLLLARIVCGDEMKM